jgi:hypothetical protein
MARLSSERSRDTMELVSMVTITNDIPATITKARKHAFPGFRTTGMTVNERTCPPKGEDLLAIGRLFDVSGPVGRGDVVRLRHV